MGLLAALGYAFFKFFRSLSSYEGRALAATGLVLIVMVLFEASLSSSLESRAVSTEVWMLLGIILGQTRFRRAGIPVFGRARMSPPMRSAAVSAAASTR
jgi:hypothetical protein